MGNRKFQKVWSKRSKTSFHYESGRLLTSNYHECFYGYGKGASPRKVFSVMGPKTEDALIYSCFHDNFHLTENRPWLITLQSHTVGECLQVCDLDTGRCDRQIFLSPVIRFKYLAWAEPNTVFFVKSVNLAYRPRFPMFFLKNIIPSLIITKINTDIDENAIGSVVLAVFSAFPLQFVGMLEIDKQVFGQGVTNAMLTHGTLIIMFISGQVEFYSFEYILEHYKLFDHDINASRTSGINFAEDGHMPQGLPINIKIKERPPVLFKVKCMDHDIKIGGFPYHCIYSPKGHRELFEVAAVCDMIKPKNSTLSDEMLNIERDICAFHADNSGRIIHVLAARGMLRVYDLKEINGPKMALELVNVAEIDLNYKEMRVQPQYTSSGRFIKKRQSIDEVNSDSDTVIHSVDYEDDLDLTYISVTNQNADLRNKVCFYDNSNMKLVREFWLEDAGHQDVCFEHTVYVDLDTIVQIMKPDVGHFVCNVYRLSGDLNQTEISMSHVQGDSKTKLKVDANLLANRRGLRIRR